ncbi:FKBP-type peptidyl-prolyl cis-trans isomerase [Daejeonella lutea]|uniref:Peptidyl-prolyl cis-trans isomerase n=1 Tax=Daejeonella lutea TaxID=572036 RepID=A0A1T5EG07_9SPHI|nr:FKBP-type peptidyl-prolyl cis-trans isomerase [Daejeonella lutea]SKB82874.1 FKBP-type peptidyl-prolyl cis-trans isomerase [Daejeonella lutea]
MKQFFKYALPGFLLLSIFVACEKEYESIESIDDKNVTAYIQANKLNVVEYQDSGIYYQVTNPGSGADVEYSDQVPMIFTIKSIDGKYSALDTFSSSNRYYNYLGYFNPEGVRVGIKEVLKKKSGTIRMIIPSRSAFGRNGSGDIPGNASLDLTVTVLDKNKMAAYEDFTIQKYIQANSLTGFTKTTSGLYYKIDVAGTGSPITADSTVKAEYEGKLLNGTIFDKTGAGSSATLGLTDVVKGWQEAIPLIKEGGTIRMILPSSLGYGLEGSTGIPAFSALFFTVKVTEVTK